MPTSHLTDARVRALRPRESAYSVRDEKLKGFGVRVYPSGEKRFFLHFQYRHRRVWQIVNNADAISVRDARAHAVSLREDICRGVDAPAPAGETRFEAVAEATFARHAKIWKPRTLAVNRSYLRQQILPWFADRPIAAIRERDVQRWFSSLRAKPAAADRSAPLLSLIFKEAELLGYRPDESNPCRGLRRYRPKGRERFLTDDEIRRLGAGLAGRPARHRLAAAAIRLLLLTGCRSDEILSLRWRDYRDGNLFLADSKTGPRTVWLSQPARELLDALPRRGRFVFPGRRAGRPRSDNWLWNHWNRIRAEVGLGDVRLHDLRHSYATLALRNGTNVLTIGRLLGHADPATTMKYTHLADAMVRAATEAVSALLEAER